MLITGREATSLVGLAGTRGRLAYEALRCGLAGEPVETPAAHLYDHARVVALAGRPTLTVVDLDERFPHGVFIARRSVHVDATFEEQAAVLAPRWRLGMVHPVMIRTRAQDHGAVPMLATVAGFVVAGADIIGAAATSDGTTTLRLQPPGPWFADARETRIPAGAGRPYVIRGWPSLGGHRDPSWGSAAWDGTVGRGAERRILRPGPR